MLDQAVLATTVLRVADLDAAADWYERTLDVAVSRAADGAHRIGSFGLPGMVVSLWELQPEEARPRGSTSDPFLTIVLSEGISDVRDELSGRGVDVAEIVRSAGFDLFRFRDPDGNLFEVSQPREAAPSH